MPYTKQYIVPGLRKLWTKAATMVEFFGFKFANLKEKHKSQKSKKERKASKKHKSVQFEKISDEDSSEDQKLRKVLHLPWVMQSYY